MKHKILVTTEKRSLMRKGMTPLIKRVIRGVLTWEGVEVPCEINVLITDDMGIKKLNKQNRKIDKTTDVLSFPMFDFKPGNPPTEETAELDPVSERLPLGDIAFSLERVKAQAEEYGHSNEREVGFLIVHSMLHLLGYDHMDDANTALMEDRQKEILNKLELYR